MSQPPSSSVPFRSKQLYTRYIPSVNKRVTDSPCFAPSFSLANRAGRVLWSVIYFLFFRFTPRPFFAWRALILRCCGAKLGRGCRIHRKVEIWAPWNLECGDQVCIADHVILYSQAKITLGTRCVISQGSHLCTGTHNYLSPAFELITHPITIGPHAWLAAETFIHPGVTIGDGAVIGARAVVTRDMPEWTVCAGHPCLPLKPRPRFA